MLVRIAPASDSPPQPPAAGGLPTAAAIAGAVGRGEASPSDLAARAAERAEAVERLNAVAVACFDDPLRDAVRGPLAGVPVSVKETIHVAGTPSSGGIPRLAGSRAYADAALVRRLREAGASIVCKGNVAQLLWFGETDNPVYGRTDNPWDATRSPGGSSGGDAALVAAGVVPVAIGTDIGGSVRLPAAWCGVAALKPTSGRLTIGGSLDEEFFAWVGPIENQPGVFARTAGDVALAYGVLAGGRAAPAPVPGLRVGVVETNGVMEPHPAIRRGVDEAAGRLSDAGAEVVDFEQYAAGEGLDLFDAVFEADGGAALEAALGSDPAHPRVRAAIDSARGRGLDERGRAELAERIDRFREAATARLDRHRLDAVVSPAHAVPAVPHGGSGDVVRGQSYSSIWNLLGHPAGVVPITAVRPDEDAAGAGLPVAVQAAARPRREDVVLGLLFGVERPREA